MTPPEFLPITDADVPGAIALWERCGTLRPWNPPEQDIADYRAHPTSDMLVAHDTGRVVATVGVGHDGHRGFVYYVATDPDMRGRGLGRAAMDAAEAWLAARGVKKLQLLVRETNLPVIGFYQRLGYEDGQCRLMQKWLDPERDRLFREATGGH
ncbi:GNAT family acetyltransferase [Mesobacterium sp. TK19101]|uniref:GNAT family acetyltransferase n=1 Tax=Mesobacterium hydrothermale TaxID=3111907 RepID=A0ABU6HLJ9_9RHOB|nr:GNAT family acetyltransferase [Mesobacterium sp. TK19101]MEC3862716.1 GNAT family acetyltransferase [Mesobacterium sp. TK19101]